MQIIYCIVDTDFDQNIAYLSYKKNIMINVYMTRQSYQSQASCLL